MVIHDPDEPQPLDIKDFVHEIDTRTGFMQDLAEDVIDFKREIEAARAETRREAKVLDAFLKNKRPGENKRVIPILSFLNEKIVHNLLPDASEKEAEETSSLYPEDLRTSIGRRHDSLLDAVRTCYGIRRSSRLTVLLRRNTRTFAAGRLTSSCHRKAVYIDGVSSQNTD